jgi:hypothetical protein
MVLIFQDRLPSNESFSQWNTFQHAHVADVARLTALNKSAQQLADKVLEWFDIRDREATESGCLMREQQCYAAPGQNPFRRSNR